jgi:uncharacterized protein (DUF433 family)
MDQQTAHITRTEGVCGGKPCIANSRIRVQDIYVWHELQGKSPDEIVGDFPQLTLADVYAALAYFWDNRDEIQKDIAREKAMIEEMKSAYPSKVRERTAASGGGNAVPS